MTVQSAMPPYTIRCLKCGEEWLPEPAKSGPSKGQHTDASLQRESDKHKCGGSLVDPQQR